MLVRLPVIDEFISAFAVSALSVRPHPSEDGTFLLQVWVDSGEDSLAIMYQHRFEDEASAVEAKLTIGAFVVSKVANLEGEVAESDEPDGKSPALH